MAISSWRILVLQNKFKIELLPYVELPNILHLKSSSIKVTEKPLIGGLWVFLSMKWLLESIHLLMKALSQSIKIFLKENFTSLKVLTMMQNHLWNICLLLI